MVVSAREALGELANFLPHSHFTKVQEKVIPSLMASDDNVVVAAPTGSGKTFLLEVAMLKMFFKRLPGKATSTTSGCVGVTTVHDEKQKAVYVCPIKALAHEKYDVWKSMFAPLSVVIETGDQDRERRYSRSQRRPLADSRTARPENTEEDAEDEGLVTVATADIIITTPERWDSITRRWKERTVLSIVHSVGLLLLDEVHTVHEDRGAALEAIVSRMKAIKAQQAHAATRSTTDASNRARCDGGEPANKTAHVRFVAISGTLPNVDDFAQWLQVKPSMVFSFSSHDRPVPLSIKVLGFSNDSNNPFAFDRFLSFRLFGLIRQYSEGKPTIVFCASRKEAASSAQRLASEIRDQAARLEGGDPSLPGKSSASVQNGTHHHLEPPPEVLEMANRANDKQLRQCLLLGIAYHHAAMTPNDRQLVERMFRDQYIAAICTTTTLALGVNLPAHLVIVKGTTFFKNGKRDDVPLSEIAQMCGRAGRPGLDSHGVALVLTTERKVPIYRNLERGDVYTTVESQLHRCMIEHVNAEVALRTIHSFASAMDWIHTTFFWIRLGKCPEHYGIRFTSPEEHRAFQPESFAERLMLSVLTALEREECIDVRSPAVDPFLVSSLTEAKEGGTPSPSTLLARDGAVVEATRVGRNMARMYILFDTVKTFNGELRERAQVHSTVGQHTEGDHRGPVETDDEDQGGNPHKGEDEDNSGDGSVTPGNGATDAAGAPLNPVCTNSLTSLTHERTTPPRLFASGEAPLELSRPFHLQDVLSLCCRCAEFDDTGLRQGDKGPLNEMNKTVKLPIKSGQRGGREVRENWHKAYVLIQAQLGQLSVAEVSLRNDFTRLWSVVPRVVRFLSEYARFTQSYSFFIFANLLLRCVEQKVWPDGLVLRQLDGVSDAVARSLSRAGFKSFAGLMKADPQKLEAICGRLPPYGSHLKAQCEALPLCCLTVEQVVAPPQSGTQRFRVSIIPNSTEKLSSDRPTDAGIHGTPTGGKDVQKPPQLNSACPVRSFLLIAGLPSADKILLLRHVSARSVFHDRDEGGGESCALGDVASGARPAERAAATFEFVLPQGVSQDNDSAVEVALVAEHWVGLDVTLSFPPRQSLVHASHNNGNRQETVTLVATSNSNEAGRLSNATALTGSHSILELMATSKATAARTVQDDPTAHPKRKKTRSSPPQHSDVARDPASPQEKVEHARVAQSSLPRSVSSAEEEEATLVCTDPSNCEREYADTVRNARVSFEDMLQDLEYIEGSRRTPSGAVRSGRRSRGEEKSATPASAKLLSTATQPSNCQNRQGTKRPRDGASETSPKGNKPSVTGLEKLTERRVNFHTESRQSDASMAGASARDVQEQAAQVEGRPSVDETAAFPVCQDVRIRRRESPEPRAQCVPTSVASRSSPTQPQPVYPLASYQRGPAPDSFASLEEEYAFRQHQLAEEYRVRQRQLQQYQHQHQHQHQHQRHDSPQAQLAASGLSFSQLQAQLTRANVTAPYQVPPPPQRSSRFHFNLQVKPHRGNPNPSMHGAVMNPYDAPCSNAVGALSYPRKANGDQGRARPDLHCPTMLTGDLRFPRCLSQSFPSSQAQELHGMMGNPYIPRAQSPWGGYCLAAPSSAQPRTSAQLYAQTAHGGFPLLSAQQGPPSAPPPYHHAYTVAYPHHRPVSQYPQREQFPRETAGPSLREPRRPPQSSPIQNSWW